MARKNEVVWRSSLTKKSRIDCFDRLARTPTHILEADPSRGPLRTRAVSGVAHSRVARRCVFTYPTFRDASRRSRMRAQARGTPSGPPHPRPSSFDLHGAVGGKISGPRGRRARPEARRWGVRARARLSRRAARVACRAARVARRFRPIGVARSPTRSTAVALFAQTPESRSIGRSDRTVLPPSHRHA